MNKPMQQHGAALISALIIMALCATIATFLLLGQRLLIHQTALALNVDRMTLALNGVQDWAIDVINSKKDIRKIPEYQQNETGLQVSGMIYALGGRFNINVLSNPNNMPHFINLLQTIIPQISRQQSFLMTIFIEQWISATESSDPYYFTLHPPYRAGHQLLVDLSELRLIRYMTAKLYQQLILGQQNYLVALPNSNYSINVNYASAPVFASIGLSLADAQQLVLCRDNSPLFQSTNDFINQCANNKNFDTSSLTVDNPYYLVTGSAKQGDQQLTMQSLIQVTLVDNKPVAKIMWQEFNGD